MGSDHVTPPSLQPLSKPRDLVIWTFLTSNNSLRAPMELQPALIMLQQPPWVCPLKLCDCLPTLHPLKSSHASGEHVDASQKCIRRFKLKFFNKHITCTSCASRAVKHAVCGHGHRTIFNACALPQLGSTPTRPSALDRSSSPQVANLQVGGRDLTDAIDLRT